MARWEQATPLSGDISSVASVESGGDPNAVSPKGARGVMQVMPDTNKAPGFGVIPARDDSEAERTRVGEDYLSKLQAKYGREGGLQAYNMGPGAYEKYKAGAGTLPAETAAYVPKVNQAGGNSTSRWSQSTPVTDDDSSEAPPGQVRIEIRGTSADEPKASTAQNAPAPPPTTQTRTAPKGFLQSALDTTLDAPTNFVAGAGKLMSVPIGAAVDVATGQKLGTDYKEREQSIEDFRKEHTHGDSIGSSVIQAAPEMIETAGVPGGTLVKALAANAAYEGAKSGLKGGGAGQVAEDAATGAAGAGAGHVLFKGVAGLRSGLSEAMRNFTDRGYVPTIGQMAGLPGKAYEKVSSWIPGMSGAIERAGNDATETVSRARANEALQAIGGRTEQTGNAASTDMSGQISKAYNAVTPSIQVNPAVGRLSQWISGAQLSSSVPNLGRLEETQVRREVANMAAPYLNRSHMVTGEEFKALDRDLGTAARAYEKSPLVSEQRKGAAIRVYQDNLRSTVHAVPGADPAVLQQLKAADTSFRLGVPVVDAAKRARATNGRFTPAQDAAATDRARQPRSAAGAEIIDNPTPKPESKSLLGTAVGYGLGAGGAGLTAIGAAAGSPLALAGGAVLATGYGAHQLINTRAGRTALLNGLAGVIPKSALGKVSGLPPEEAARVLKEWMAKPEVARVAAQVGRQLTNGGQNAP